MRDVRHLAAFRLLAFAVLASSATHASQSFTTNKDFEDLTPTERNAAKADATRRKFTIVSSKPMTS